MLSRGGYAIDEETSHITSIAPRFTSASLGRQGGFDDAAILRHACEGASQVLIVSAAATAMTPFRGALAASLPR